MRAGSYEILVHAGAHCTGSRDFQRFIAANRASLTDAGYDLAYPGRDGAAGGTLDAALPEPRHSAEQCTGLAATLAGRLAPVIGRGERGLILSEHDLAGGMVDLLGGRFYPAARRRAEALRIALGRPVDRLVIVLKPYDTIFVSAWRRFAVDRQIEAFADYAPAMAGFLGGWVDLVEDLRGGLEARSVTVLANRPGPQELLAHLAPGAVPARPICPAAMPRITDSAVAMAQRHFRQGARFAPGQRDRILAFHAHQPQTPSVHGFAGLALADLRGRYVADLDTLSRLHGVEMIGSVLPAMAAE